MLLVALACPVLLSALYAQACLVLSLIVENSGFLCLIDRVHNFLMPGLSIACYAWFDTNTPLYRSREKYSSIRYASPVKTEAHKGSRSLERRRSSSGSPQKRIYDRKDSREKDLPLPPQLSRSPSVPESPHRSRSDSESPPTKRGRSPSEDRGYMISLIIL